MTDIILQVGVKVLLQNSKDEYLLLRRNTQMYPNAGDTWDVVGGRIDPGETLYNNLVREVKEETQFAFDGDIQLVGAQDILKVPGRHVVRLTYRGEIDGEPVIDEESREWGWFSRREILQMSKEGVLDEFLEELIDTKKISL